MIRLAEIGVVEACAVGGLIGVCRELLLAIVEDRPAAFEAGVQVCVDSFELIEIFLI